tara:strand:- start:48 stop:605 length:558 start_codon:yes stop_codon:yes gene_type:complete
MANSFLDLGISVSIFFVSFLILIFKLRFLMSLFRVDYYNPITQFVIKFTKPFIVFLFFLPRIRSFELSSFVLLISLYFLDSFLESYTKASLFIYSNEIIPALKSCIFGILNTLVVIFIILAVSSWFTPLGHGTRNPVLNLVNEITSPILYKIRSIIPVTFGVIDFSVAIAIFIFLILKNIINILI